MVDIGNGHNISTFVPFMKIEIVVNENAQMVPENDFSLSFVTWGNG